MPDDRSLRSHLAEFIGTFMLVVAVAFGLVIAVMIYGVGHISGAHFNPVVSVGFALSRHVPWRRVATYSMAQVGGAVAGAMFLRLTLGDVPLGVTHPSVPAPSAVAWEVVFTAMLMLVIMAVATDTRAVGPAAALAIGGSITLAALVAGPVSGASLNPARSLGPALVAGDLADIWIYVLGPLLGAIIGAVAYRYLRDG